MPSGTVFTFAILAHYLLGKVADMNEPLMWRDRWTIWLWAFLVFMNFSFALAIWAAFDTRSAFVDFLLTLLLTIYLSMKTPLRISVEDGWLYIGKAKIELKYIGSIDALGQEAMALARTREANPNAYLALRFWVPRGVKIEIKDSRDYTPYWLISTNKADEIVKKIKN